MSQSSSQQKNLITACASFLHRLCGLLGVLLWKRGYILFSLKKKKKKKKKMGLLQDENVVK